MTTWLNTSFQMQFRVIDGLTVRYARSEDGHQDALLLSPWPESLLAFVPVWPWLAADTRLVAIDLPGFGHSQRRDALMSPQAMAGFVLRAADAFGLGHLHLARTGHRDRRRPVRRGRRSGPACAAWSSAAARPPSRFSSAAS